jgi:hypothetical protein
MHWAKAVDTVFAYDARGAICRESGLPHGPLGTRSASLVGEFIEPVVQATWCSGAWREMRDCRTRRCTLNADVRAFARCERLCFCACGWVRKRVWAGVRASVSGARGYGRWR